MWIGYIKKWWTISSGRIVLFFGFAICMFVRDPTGKFFWKNMISVCDFLYTNKQNFSSVWLTEVFDSIILIGV